MSSAPPPLRKSACFALSFSLSLAALTACTPALDPPVPSLDHLGLPVTTRQVLLVQSSSWNDSSGTLRAFAREPGSPWTMHGSPIPVQLGRHGLAWGLGLHHLPDSGIRKAEGDGRAPAGIFEFGDAFGASPAPPDGLRLPYRHATERDLFIDDPASPDYNQWVTASNADPSKTWKSFETMRREDGLYNLGLILRHNMNPPIPGSGSAIFLHIWRGPDQPTSGCTAMARQDLERVLTWLDPSRNPLFIQIPETELIRLQLTPDPS